MYDIFEKCCEIFKQAIVYNINQLVVTKTLKNMYLKKMCCKKERTSILVKRGICVAVVM